MQPFDDFLAKWLAPSVGSHDRPGTLSRRPNRPVKLLRQPKDIVNAIFSACSLQTIGRFGSTCKYLHQKISRAEVEVPLFSKLILDPNLLSKLKSAHQDDEINVEVRYRLQMKRMSESLPTFPLTLKALCYEALANNLNFKSRHDSSQKYQWKSQANEAYAELAAKGDQAAKEWLETELSCCSEWDRQKAWLLLGIGQFYLHHEKSEAAKKHLHEAHKVLTDHLAFGCISSINILASPKIASLLKTQLDIDSHKQLSDFLKSKIQGCSYNIANDDTRWISSVFCHSGQLPKEFEEQKIPILMRIFHALTDPYDLGRTENTTYDVLRDAIADKIRFLTESNLPKQKILFTSSTWFRGELLICLDEDISSKKTCLTPFFKKEYVRKFNTTTISTNCLVINEGNWADFKNVIFPMK